ncbi:MAG: carbamoyltransferase HypF [Gemmatimonadaceae bacterium]
MTMIERRLIAVEGVVQGVGFRPFVHRLAAAGRLRGSVRNGAKGVLIDVEGELASLNEFCRSLSDDMPPLACIERLAIEQATPRAYGDFRIEASEGRSGESEVSRVPPDFAPCDACLSELFDPDNRRFSHPFITCTDCGPRFTIVRDTPYDRERTTMAAFEMCADCHREYDDPADRRFHAEAIACHACGPTLRAERAASAGPSAQDAAGGAAIASAVQTIRQGGIVAVKALGGYHLACDATNDGAVQRLRARKHRIAKPFAIMVRDIPSARLLCELSRQEQELLESSARPIVLLSRRCDANVSPSVAPGQRTLGVMLPSTPLHHLLVARLDCFLVMTSGNQSDEPVAIDDKTARDSLGDIADLFLLHDRAIASRCDDSVVRLAVGEARVVRRARGYVPRSIRLSRTSRQAILALGGHLKNTVCLVRENRAMVSAHVGDLDTVVSRQALRDTIVRVTQTAGRQPSVIAHDLHPDYASTRVAEEIATELGIDRRVAVQHHHAHIASCVAEYSTRGPVIGVAFDGAGLGTDGAIWGGEFLLVDGAQFRRCGHLAYVPLPGGDAAARRPWRSAAAHLASASYNDAQHTVARPSGVAEVEWSLVHQMLARGGAIMPRTSSVGRLFDAASSLLGVCHVAQFEGEAAMALEAVADLRAARRYSFEFSGDDVWTADPSSIIRGMVDDRRRGLGVAEIAGAFHAALSDLVVRGSERVRHETGVETVVLTGGVFMNSMLLERAAEALANARFVVRIPRLVPCNDGGLSLGQAYVAACALEEDVCA